MRVFVTGATGLIGSALCGALLEKGHAVTAVSRAGDAARGLPPGVRTVKGDPAQAGAWQEELAGSDACVHLAGEPIAEGRWTAEKKRRLRASRVDSTARVAEVIRSAGPEVLVQGSAVGFYGSRGDEPLDESSAAGEGFLADLSREWEAAAAPAAARARVVLLRTGVVLARDAGALPKLALPFRMMAGGPIGDGSFWFPWIHLQDEIGLALLALEDGRVAGPLNATAPEPVRNRDLARALGDALGRPSFVRTPRVVVRLALGEAAEAVLASQRVLPRRALELGYAFRFPEIGAALGDLLGR